MISSPVAKISPARPKRCAGGWRLVALLCGGLLATGAHWDLVQVVAWTRMAALTLQAESPVRELDSFFAPEKRCGICHVVNAAQSESVKESALAGWFVKSPLLLPAPAAIVIPEPLVSPQRWFTASSSQARRAEAPPVPPPRHQVA